MCISKIFKQFKIVFIDTIFFPEESSFHSPSCKKKKTPSFWFLTTLMLCSCEGWVLTSKGFWTICPPSPMFLWFYIIYFLRWSVNVWPKQTSERRIMMPSNIMHMHISCYPLHFLLFIYIYIYIYINFSLRFLIILGNVFNLNIFLKKIKRVLDKT